MPAKTEESPSIPRGSSAIGGGRPSWSVRRCIALMPNAWQSVYTARWSWKRSLWHRWRSFRKGDGAQEGDYIEYRSDFLGAAQKHKINGASNIFNKMQNGCRHMSKSRSGKDLRCPWTGCAKRQGGRRPSAADLTVSLGCICHEWPFSAAAEHNIVGYRNWTPGPFAFSEMCATGIITLWLPNRDANRQPVTKS